MSSSSFNTAATTRSASRGPAGYCRADRYAARRIECLAASTSWREWLRNLMPFIKGAFVAVLILLAVAWYVLTGRVTTDDAQVDCHITAVAPQVPGYVVQLLINDNTPVKEGDLLVQIDPRDI